MRASLSPSCAATDRMSHVGPAVEGERLGLVDIIDLVAERLAPSDWQAVASSNRGLRATLHRPDLAGAFARSASAAWLEPVGLPDFALAHEPLQAVRYLRQVERMGPPGRPFAWLHLQMRCRSLQAAAYPGDGHMNWTSWVLNFGGSWHFRSWQEVQDPHSGWHHRLCFRHEETFFDIDLVDRPIDLHAVGRLCLLTPQLASLSLRPWTLYMVTLADRGVVALQRDGRRVDIFLLEQDRPDSAPRVLYGGTVAAGANVPLMWEGRLHGIFCPSPSAAALGSFLRCPQLAPP